MKSLQVIRTASSSYHRENFFTQEKHRLESLQGIKYSESFDIAHNSDVILITNTHSRLSSLPEKILEKTKLIIHSNSGYDHFISEQKLWQNIPVVIGHKIRAQAVAEYSIAALLDAFIKIPFVSSWDNHRYWQRSLISSKKIGIYGHGHIGKIVSATLLALGADVSIHDPFKNLKHKFPLKELDAIIFCCGLNSSSKHLGNKDFFNQLKEDVVIINGARGSLISQKDLKDFLKDNSQTQIYLDVFEQEPFDDDWKNFDQVKKTSHVAGVFDNLDEKIIEFEYNTIHDFLTLSKEEFIQKHHLSLLINKIHDGAII